MDQRVRQRISAPVRLRFVLGGGAVDLALPGETLLVDLLPAVLPQAGGPKKNGLDHIREGGCGGYPS